MRRREFIAALGSTAAWPLMARAQRIPKIGVLWHAANAEEEGPLFRGLVEGFRDLRYVEGGNIMLEHRFPDEMPERFKSMAAELVSLNVDVLVCAGTVAASALTEATKTIPIVFMFIPGPGWQQISGQLRATGRKYNGIVEFCADLIGKRLQFSRR